MAADAIIFIPGIKGTKLVESNRVSHDTIWSGVQSNFETIEDLELAYITDINNPRGFDSKHDTIIIPQETEELAYREFIRDIETDLPKYIFSYDWRQSTQYNGEKLKEFIEYLTEKSKAINALDNPHNKSFKKFHFITHSMGNYILRYYLKKYGFDRTEKTVFAVPPFKGSLDMVRTALLGEGLFDEVKTKIRKMIRTMPGPLELLPFYEGAAVFKTGEPVDFFNFENWQGNIKNSDKPYNLKMKNALAVAQQTVNEKLLDLNNITPDQSEKILIIVRGGFKTYQHVRVEKNQTNEVENFVDFNNSLINFQGDRNVPHASSCCYCKTITTLLLEDSFLFCDYDHGFTLRDERVQKIINRFLNSDNPDYHIPGGSIKRVKDLVKETDGEYPFWKVINGD